MLAWRVAAGRAIRLSTWARSFLARSAASVPPAGLVAVGIILVLVCVVLLVKALSPAPGTQPAVLWTATAAGQAPVTPRQTDRPAPQLTQTALDSVRITQFAISTSLPAPLQDEKGVKMALVPAGEFIMGGDADLSYQECEKFRTDNTCERGWFTDSALWEICAELIALFDELNERAIGLPEDEDILLSRLEQAYDARGSQLLRFEAEVVHRLWRAEAAGPPGRHAAMAMALAELAGKAAVANTKIIYQAFKRIFSSPRFIALQKEKSAFLDGAGDAVFQDGL